MGERLNGIQEVSGSNPLISTKSDVFRFAKRDVYFISDVHYLRDVWLHQVIRNTSHHCE